MKKIVKLLMVGAALSLLSCIQNVSNTKAEDGQYDEVRMVDGMKYHCFRGSSATFGVRNITLDKEMLQYYRRQNVSGK